MGFSMMTEIQAETIPHLLEGRDLVGAAKTGIILYESYTKVSRCVSVCLLSSSFAKARQI